MNSELPELRKQIDRCDEELVELMRRRFEITAQVGHLKRLAKADSIDPSREQRQFARIKKLAKKHGVNSGLATVLLRSIIDQVVADHEAIKHKAMPAILSISKPKVGIVGMGAFGKLAANQLSDLCSIECFDARSKNKSIENVLHCDFVILAVPLASIESVLTQIKPSLKPSTTLIDVCSVKQKPIELFNKVLPGHKNVVYTHPLFGPQSTADGLKGHTIIFCNQNSASRTVQTFCREQLGLKVVSMSAEEHDKIMADMHALTFFVARGLNNLGLKPSKFQAPSFQMLLDLVELDKAHSQELFETVECGNIFAKDVRKQLIDELKKIDADLCQD